MYEGGCYVFRNDQNALYNQLFSEACPIIDEKPYQLVRAIFITHLKELFGQKNKYIYSYSLQKFIWLTDCDAIPINISKAQFS